jgi:hypothetical protein
MEVQCPRLRIHRWRVPVPGMRDKHLDRYHQQQVVHEQVLAHSVKIQADYVSLLKDLVRSDDVEAVRAFLPLRSPDRNISFFKLSELFKIATAQNSLDMIKVLFEQLFPSDTVLGIPGPVLSAVPNALDLDESRIFEFIVSNLSAWDPVKSDYLEVTGLAGRANDRLLRQCREVLKMVLSHGSVDSYRLFEHVTRAKILELLRFSKRTKPEVIFFDRGVLSTSYGDPVKEQIL